jgi:four helix bundle protein
MKNNLDFWILTYGSEMQPSAGSFQTGGRSRKLKAVPIRRTTEGATLSHTNNIAEGSGSVSDADFASFLNIARRSVLEVANMLLLFFREGYLAGSDVSGAIAELEEQSKKIPVFRRRLKS